MACMSLGRFLVVVLAVQVACTIWISVAVATSETGMSLHTNVAILGWLVADAVLCAWMLIRPPRVRRDERGASAVEMALVSPFLVVLVLGIVTFGIVFAQSMSVQNGAHAAARLGAAEDTATCAEMVAEAVALANEGVAMEDNPVGPGDVAVTVGGAPCSDPPCEGAGEDAAVKVVISYAAEPFFPVVPGPLNIEKTGEFKCEYDEAG